MYVAPHKRNGSAAKHPNPTRTNGASKAPITSSQNHEKHPSQNSIESSPKTATNPVVSPLPTWGKGATFAQIVKQHADIPQKSSLQLKEEVKAASCNVKRPTYSKKTVKVKEDHLVEEDSDFDLKPVTWTNTGRKKKGQVSPGETDLQQFDWGEPMGTRQDKATLKREGKKRLDHEYRRQKAIMTKDAQRAGVEVLPLMESFGAFAQKQQSKGKK